ncbi:hypothetical protein SERLA73DRAFT_70152 [Serpula lacrymans var. lacrymans S7.3]|uniref:Uncharacterized protein n=2 Tax=Serpula lacrymans var. lacrymans TaxID=341189 RepID=F8PM27_SERL3|nr:uncharacterized protein SERLADRAFT_434274 [Serpula lacrymans var. lacrymans S7.9]EGO02659.1 hypothetical protein SERLA73DRAFT_70152 [Serpula lacrymans var. lacrymans S7.3]EGO28364.1 hypothetical protein SERLADRAFT_434274 [Serpula lacrymans var. lacrymans S7.9]
MARVPNLRKDTDMLDRKSKACVDNDEHQKSISTAHELSREQPKSQWNPSEQIDGPHPACFLA